jgi:hypothetical protein
MRNIGSLLWCALFGLFRSCASLQVEVLTLRQQLNVLQRKVPARSAYYNQSRTHTHTSAWAMMRQSGELSMPSGE